MNKYLSLKIKVISFIAIIMEMCIRDRVKSVELLLKEKIPSRITFDREEIIEGRRNNIEVEETIPRIYEGARRENPEVLLLSNGSYSVMTTLTGSGYAKKDNMTIYRDVYKRQEQEFGF